MRLARSRVISLRRWDELEERETYHLTCIVHDLILATAKSYYIGEDPSDAVVGQERQLRSTVPNNLYEEQGSAHLQTDTLMESARFSGLLSSTVLRPRALVGR